MKNLFAALLISTSTVITTIKPQRVDLAGFLDSKGVVILKVDRDGDIFLRGKWIGYDKRLSKIYTEGK